MKTIECWDIRQWDGGDRHNHVFYLTSDEEKERYMETNRHDYAQKTVLVIYDNLAEVEEHKVEKLRESAIKKLTLPERKALGLI